ncbi:MAG TPA: endolytic transglycosylase MltG [Baekduia sp.]|uniref:endolytic transglycosylase MltG n=1 Tax=Baekduia sp. TaxID=2600305 RepID=UPI002CE75FA4|nr:endolytic transglycosylase MltG [Baekduia sp.]HMJ33034.1 endolytic transglycosylase MltG [Baekduia sp.]
MTPLFGGDKKGTSAEQRARSAAEREAARLERERRRAEREGRPLPPVPEPASTLPPEGQAPRQETHEPVSDEAGLLPFEDQAEPVYEPEPDFEPDPEPVFEPEPVTVPASDEAPAGVRRVAAPSVRDLPEVAGPRPAGPKGRQKRPPRQRGLPRARRGRRLIPLLVLVVVVAVGYFAFRVAQPFAGEGDAAHPVRVTIQPGATAGEIGDELAQQGVIDSAFFFNIRSRLSGKRADLKAGSFTLKRDMSYTAALDALTQNPAAAPTVKVTMPEGRSIREAAPAVRGAVSGSYVKAATRNPREVTGLKNYGVPRGTKTLEGFLFPATYELKRGAKTATASKLVAQQLATFRESYNKLDRRGAKRKNLSDYDVLIIASMIEREAGVAKDRKLISAVIYNRLKDHMPLGIDATLRYGLDNWTRPLKQSELQKDSAFNTRTRQGLPPTPIGSPGLASIKAALAPANVSYLFYVVKPCGNGAHAFSSSDAQFTKDVQAYNRKRDQLGGKDPSHC